MISDKEFNKHLLELRPKLRVFASMLSLTEEDAEDLTQDTITKAIIHKDKFTDDKSIRAWLFTIMKNIFINSYRRNKTYRELLQKTGENSELRFWNQYIANNADSNLYASELWNEIYKLDNKFSIPFIFFVKGYKYREIADFMQMPIGTVKSRIYYARKLLSEQLSELQDTYSS
jgi:RNA polymerase sigma factor (sigma-70 family)